MVTIFGKMNKLFKRSSQVDVVSVGEQIFHECGFLWDACFSSKFEISILQFQKNMQKMLM
jgi:hypothetical protein